MDFDAGLSIVVTREIIEIPVPWDLFRIGYVERGRYAGNLMVFYKKDR